MRFFIPQIPLVAMTATLFLTPVLTAAPEAAASRSAGSPKIVWQIGKEDQDDGEFALVGNNKEYSLKFPQKTLLYEIGKSNPATDWPYIQPGTADAWGTRQIQPRVIRFALADEPRGVFVLRVAMVDVHPSDPSVLKVAVNGQEGSFSFNPGAGVASILNAHAGKSQVVEARLAASGLKKGVNEITLSTDEGGSWLIYDAITLLNDASGNPPPALNNLRAVATPCFVRHGDALDRVVSLELTASGYDTAPTIQASVDGSRAREVPLGPLPPFGTVRADVSIPDSGNAQAVSLTATLGGQTRTTELRVEPARKWTIYIAPASHTDIGYTDIQEKTLEGHNQDTDKAIELTKTYPDYRWNLEVAVQAESYLANRTQRDDFLRLAHEGRIGVMALYANTLTGLCSHAAACHLFQWAADLHRLYGVRFGQTAMLNDVPSAEASLPMIAANSGIRYLAHAVNNDHAPTFQPYATNNPCWWEGPDGSRVLTVFSKQYGLARSWGVTTSVDRTRNEVRNKLGVFEKRADYPYDAVFVHGEQGDNTRLDPRIAEVTKQWNEHYAYPRIVLSSGPDFFEHIEKNYGGKLPVIKGSGGAYWEDGAGSSAHETALDRRSQATLASAECLLALAQRIKPDTYPKEQIAAAWRNCLLYDEHTWGAGSSISRPEAPGTIVQWKNKARFALDAQKESGELLAQGLQTLGGQIRTKEPSLVVFNPSGWKRSEIISVNLPKGLAITEPGVTTCETESGCYAWVADVPSCGYRTLKLGPAVSPPKAQPAAGHTLESRSYRIGFDPATGGIGSLVDKETGRELVDPRSPYKLNEYLYVAGGKGGLEMLTRRPITGNMTINTPHDVTLQKMTLGQLGEMMVIESSATMTPKLRTVVIAWNDTKRIDIENTLDKKLTYDLEAGYFAFPFVAENPTFRYEIPVGIVNATTDMLPGACLNWFAVQHFAEVSGTEGTVVWATPDAPMACFEDIVRGEWKKTLPMVNGHLFSYAFNNYWQTNYRAGQDGTLGFRFAITSRTASDPTASARFGAGVSNPLPSLVVGANPNGSLTAQAGSLLGVAEPNAQLIEVRQANDGAGTIVRLWETSGKETTAHLDVRALGAKKASACNLVEDGSTPLELNQGVAAVPLKSHGVATVRLE